MLQQRLTRNLYTGQTEPLTAPLSFDFTEDLGNKRNLSLLSQYGGAAAAYSLRALGSYNEHVVRVRRASDNDEQDFTASQVSDGTLESFCGVGDGFVETWYDQSGNGRDATQSVATAQPKIVDGGALVTDANGNPSTLYDGSNDQLTNANGIPAADNTGAFCMIVLFNDIGGDNGYVCGSTNAIGGGSSIYSNSGAFVLADAGNVGADSYANDNTNLTLAVANYDNNIVNLRTNGVAGGTNAWTYTFAASNTFTIANRDSGGAGATFFGGNVTEIIIYDTTQLTNIAAIETNIKTAYGIT